MANLKNEKIGIVGSGLIGKSWAMIFASEGFNVKLYDVDKNQVAKAIEVIFFFIKYSPRHYCIADAPDLCHCLDLSS